MREVTCPFEMQQEDWNTFRLVNYPITPLFTAFQCSKPLLWLQNYPLLTEDFRMALHTRDAQLKHMNLSDAFRQGYVFQLTDGRLVFRTAYGQQNSVATKVNVQ